MENQEYENNGFSAFTMIFVIMDLVFAALRLILVLLGIIGFMTMSKNDPIYITGIFEITTGAALVFLGFLGNILILLKKSIGIPICYILIFFVVVNMGVGIWQNIFKLLTMNIASPEAIGMIFGGTISSLVRISLLVCYGIAVYQAKNTIDKIINKESRLV